MSKNRVYTKRHISCKRGKNLETIQIASIAELPTYEAVTQCISLQLLAMFA